MTFAATTCKERRMFTPSSRTARASLSPPRAYSIVQAALVFVLAWSCETAWAERLYPVALMNWMVEGTFHALIVDKSQQTMSVWRIKDGEPEMVESYRCSTGENEGDKWVRGDMKTPEGVYFFCSVIDGRTLPAKYGLWAFTTDYPNFVDRRRGKSGDGIWLHGRDRPLAAKPDSNGCIALENRDLLRVSKYVRLQSTPLIVVKKMIMAPRSTIVEQERGVRDFIEGWRQAWESKSLDGYMGYYSPNFQSCWLDFKAWKEKKRRLNGRYRSIRVKLGDIYLYRQNGLVTAIFTQSYASDAYQCTGIKVLYLTDRGKYAIYAEDYHKPVDDPFPVRVLLAAVGVEPKDRHDTRRDFRIRLVSTDEPEKTVQDDEERPRPTAPAKGAVLEKLARSYSREGTSARIDVNERFSDGTASKRLIVASVEALYEPADSLAAEERFGERTARYVESTAGVEDKEEHTSPVAGTADGSRHGLTASLSGGTAAPVPAAKPAAADPSEQPVRKPSASKNDSGEKQRVLRFLQRWKTAWQKKNLDRYAKMYHPDCRMGNMDRKMFRKSKRRLFNKYRNIRVEFERLDIRKVEDRIHVRFLQSFQGDDYRDKGWKDMVLVGGKDKGFRILSEEWAPL